jgi:Transglutaminase-like superfamily
MKEKLRQQWRQLRCLTILIPLAVSISAATAGPIDPNNPPEGRFADEWLEIYMAGGKVGYAHSTMARNGDRISTSVMFHIRLGRADQPVTIETTQSTVETLNARPLSFSSETNMATIKSGQRGTVTGDRVTIINTQLGMEHKSEYAFPKGAIMSWGLFRESLLRGFEPGLTYTVDMYTPDLRLDGAVQAVTVVGDWEEISLRGKKIKGQRVTVTMQSPIGEMEMVSWVGKDAMPLKSKLPIPGMGDMILLAANEETALAAFVPPEMFMTSVIKAKKPIDYKKAKRITYHIFGNDAPVSFDDMPETDAQKIIKRSENSIDITLTRVPHTPASDRRGKPLTTDELREFLGANLIMNVDDPELIKLAKRAAGSERDPFALGDKLRVFVTDYITEKNLTIGFATASEVARNKEGDCSEHGVLLAALGRIAGLPSRVAVGLAYVPIFGGGKDIFGYHMWTQFYIDGRWIDFDAALRESDCSPIRIAFATSSLKNAGLADLSLPLLSKIGAIDIDVIKIEN